MGLLARRTRRRCLIAAVIGVVILTQCLLSLASGTKIFSARRHVDINLLRPGRRPAQRQGGSRADAAYANSPGDAKFELRSSPCPLKKVSMLYGGHVYPQMTAALETHRQNCDRWGCEFETLEQDLTDRKLYSKHYYLLSMMLQELAKPLEKRTEWLMWVDADSILINPAISPCIFLPPGELELESVFALVTADDQGLNNGIFYLRVHQSSVDLLTQVIDYPLAHPDEDLGWFGEQAAMGNVIKAIESRSKGKPPGIAWIPREWVNTFELESGFEGEPGNFIVHFAGLGETRLSHMAYWLNELADNQAEWEVPLEQTFYKSAIPKYWSEFAVNSTRS